MDEDPQSLVRIVELGEAEAYADFYHNAPADFAARHGVRVERIGSAVAILMPDLDAMLFNRVMGLGVREPATPTMVDDIVALYQRAGIQSWAVQLNPAAQGSELPAWLEARGLAWTDAWPKMIRGIEPLPAIRTDLRVECIGAERARAFAQALCGGFGMPDWLGPWAEATIGRAGWRHYLAFDGDKPVATGALFVRHSIGWLGMAATLPSHRGRGAQGALMADRIRDGIALGCRWLITETGQDTPAQPNPSYHNMLRTGFRLAYQRANYMPASA
jgi:GNAT superfamily N-acetyltransferase